MIIPTDTGLHAQETLEQEVCFVGEHFQVFAPQPRKSVDTPRYLVTMDVGIGDAVAVGLSAIEQIVSNDPGASGKSDVLCNPLQSEIFRYDPRVNRIIETSLVFFPSTRFLTWYKLFKPERRARPLLRFFFTMKPSFPVLWHPPCTLGWAHISCIQICGSWHAIFL